MLAAGTLSSIVDIVQVRRMHSMLEARLGMPNGMTTL